MRVSECWKRHLKRIRMARSDYKYKNIFSEYANRIEALRKDLKRLKYLKIIQTDNTDRYDRSKFVISVKHAPMSSHELYEILLHRYHLQMGNAGRDLCSGYDNCGRYAGRSGPVERCVARD